MRKRAAGLGKAMKARRQYLGLTQAALAEGVEVSVELISRIERGRCAPSLSTLLGVCEVLKTTPNDLLGIRGTSSNDTSEMVAAFQLLPKPRRRELTRIAEALVKYEKK